MGMNAGSHHLTASFLSRQLQLSNLPVYKLCQIVTMQPMWCKVEESSTLVCPIRLVCLNDRQLDANNPPVSVYTLTTQPRWSNQIITICLSNTMGLHQVLEDSHALRMWGFMQVRSIQLLYFKQALATQKTYQYANCYNGTHVVQPKHQHVVVQ